MQDDISKTIVAKSDQLNACDIIAAPVTVKVLDVKVSAGDQPVSIKIDGGHQPFKPCLTVRRILAKLWGPSSKQWIGQSMTLYCDETVLWAGERTGGIRVSHVTGINSEQSVVTRASKHKAMSYLIRPLIIDLPTYSDDDIKKNSDAWIKAFIKGTDPHDLIEKIRSEYTLTDSQTNEILKLKEAKAKEI